MLVRLLTRRLFLPTIVLILLTLGLASFLWDRSLGAQQRELVQSLAHSASYFLEDAEKMLFTAAKVAETSDPEKLYFYLNSSRKGFAFFDSIYRLNQRGVIEMIEPYNQ
ncbi:MAG: hypothetical protein JW884_09930, partial [Deltaproteobacteria bacterium]|nr:hypothetical protein [Deltaproteobacteria bacterium]